MDTARCALIDPANAVPLVQGGVPQTYSYEGTNHQALACAACGHVFFIPPSTEELTRHYNETYGALGHTSWYNVEADYATAKVSMRSQRVLELAGRFGFDRSHRYHEIGCAFGGTVHALNRAGVTATGSDLNASAIAQGTGAGNTAIYAGYDPEILRREGIRPNVIYGFHVLEHMPDPVGYLRQARDCLADDAIMILFVPNAMALDPTICGFGGYVWYAYPEHLAMWAPGSLPCLAQAAGFDLLDVHTANAAIDPATLKVALGPRINTPLTDLLFDRMTTAALAGEELVFVLAASGSPVAARHAADRAAAARASLGNRAHETAVRAQGAVVSLMDRDRLRQMDGTQAWTTMAAVRDALARQADQIERQAAALDRQAEALAQHQQERMSGAEALRAAEQAREELWHARRKAELHLAAVEGSTFWKLTALPRRLLSRLRRG